jgi:hypothetical protein
MGLLIVATVFLIIVLYRLNLVLIDLKKASEKIAQVSKDISDFSAKLKETFANISEMIKGFLSSFKTVEVIKDKIEDYLSKKK